MINRVQLGKEVRYVFRYNFQIHAGVSLYASPVRESLAISVASLQRIDIF